MSDTIQIPYTGNRYEAAVPDTLDLADRAALAIRGMGGTLDPELLMEYFHVFSVTRRNRTFVTGRRRTRRATRNGRNRSR